MSLVSLASLVVSAAAAALAPPPDHLSNLRNWVGSAGGDVAAISVRDIDGIRGVQLEQSSPLMTEFMKVPAACGLSDDLDELLGTPVGAAIGRSQLSLLQPDAHLALRLLHEASLGEVSPWYDYIALLPEHVPVARHISDESLLASRSDYLLKQSMAARNYATGLEATLKRLVEGNGGDGEDVSVLINLERLGWALDIVHSRSLTVDMGRDDPRGVRRFLIPLVDFLNHAGDGCAFTYDEKDDPPSFIIELKEGDEVRAPSPKQQLHLDYGDKTCEELWLMYGFVPDAPTPYDAVTLDGAYSDEDVAAMEAADAPSDMLEEKRHLLESNRYGPPRCFGITGRQVDPAIVCALRLMFLTADELRDECNGNWNRPLLHAPVSLDNERLILAIQAGPPPVRRANDAGAGRTAA